MTSSIAAIVEELKIAFPSTRAGRFVPMVNSVLGDEPVLVEADFADKNDWTNLLPEWLDEAPDGLASALSFLAGEALRFYIPAYLVADLMGSLYRVDPTYVLVHGFDDMSRHQRIWSKKEQTWTDFACARWDGLTQKQAAAVVRYLEWRVKRDSMDAAQNIIEALKAYWYARAAGLQPDLF